MNLGFDNFPDSGSLSDIYSKRVKGKPPINTTGLISSSPVGGAGVTYEKDPTTQRLEAGLSKTLSKIMQQVNPQSPPEPSVSPEQEAMDNIKKALKELQDLKG